MPNRTDTESFLAGYPPDVRELTVAARSFLRSALPGATETLDESARVIGYGYGPGYKAHVCTLILSRTDVKLGIAWGAELPDPKYLMTGTGKVHRHVPLATIADLKQPGLKTLLKSALSACKARMASSKALA
jgi:hypothetical protein